MHDDMTQRGTFSMEPVARRLSQREYFLNHDRLRIDLEEATGMDKFHSNVRDQVWHDADRKDIDGRLTAFSRVCGIIAEYERLARLIVIASQTR